MTPPTTRPLHPAEPPGMAAVAVERTSSSALRLALRKPDAAAACGISDESFDRYVRPHVPRVRLGSVTVWPVAGLQAFLEDHGRAPVDEFELGETR